MPARPHTGNQEQVVGSISGQVQTLLFIHTSLLSIFLRGTGETMMHKIWPLPSQSLRSGGDPGQ